MSLSDPIGDLLTRIRNGQHARKSTIDSPSSRFRQAVLSVLKQEGFIRDFSDKEVRPGVRVLEIQLKYDNGKPVIREINRVSTPGRRVYSSVKTLPKVYNGLGISILSTPRGVMSDHDARQHNVGGELICTVF